MTPEVLAVTLEVARILEELGLRYCVGGSLASSVHGVPRATENVDIVVEIEPAQVEALVQQLSESFYVDEERAREAAVLRVQRGTLDTAYLERGAVALGVDDLLLQARDEAAPDPS